MAFAKNKKLVQDFSKVTISLASPESILERSNGEVVKPETINYRTYKPEMGGLFCERIFGPVKDWECHCGKYKRIRYKGIICDRCGVEVTEKKVRRERMGHIELVVPVAHIWYFKSLPNKIGYLLGLPTKKLDQIIYYERYVVVQPGVLAEEGVQQLDFLTEDEYLDIIDKLPGRTRCCRTRTRINSLPVWVPTRCNSCWSVSTSTNSLTRCVTLLHTRLRSSVRLKR
ncbi:hypothetical protein [Hymenobacter volaticus]|uniref:hypothetical protein n=1 Tax=Hymenobacter volaticus TaxID=2932254 RepID=UPI002469648F|nr:hypothetical protein [Hymenobacter volaticus]